MLKSEIQTEKQKTAEIDFPGFRISDFLFFPLCFFVAQPFSI
jgi:hypothetical protein